MSYLVVGVIIGLLIMGHELGHFLAARAVGVPVELFSIGFGPAIWKKRFGGTEFRLSLIPLGGFVLPAVTCEDDFFRIPVHYRIMLFLGGPVANLVIALMLISIYNVLTGGFSITGAFIEPFRQTASMMHTIIISITNLFTQPGSVSGIVGILHQGGGFVKGGALHAVRLAFILSVNLAVFNLLPVPVLDGGKIFLFFLEKINLRFQKIYAPIMVAGWLVIIGLIIYATALDIGRLMHTPS
ncbi:MAG: hypothetical protein A2176_10290 [Spirochaetes bacterium RBG_13_51_14]|nr:MAG: hypothetical protein A2176_10290 [Spirochaetes bacterium RBG_13_51_14]